MAIKIKAMIEKSVEVKTVIVSAKVRDAACYEFKDSKGNTVRNLDDIYVPEFFPGQHYGDYLELEIDLSTGQILNWNPPTENQLKSLFEGDE